MNNHNNSGLPIVPLRYSVPLLVICIVALGILVFVFNLSAPVVLFTPPVGAVNVTSCGVLGQNDTYYYLNMSLSFPGVTCFTITGNNTVLDGESMQTLVGNNTPGTAGVIVLGKNVTVKGLNISSADVGILLNGAPNATITLNYINNSAHHAVLLNLSSSSKVTQNILSYPNFYGVLLELSSYNIVQNNLVLANCSPPNLITLPKA